MDKSLLNFSVQVYGDFESRNETTSTARCRIFYTGVNRNGSFISDEFAEKLLKTLPYTPIKGIYDYEQSDYTTHGGVNSEGRIYGVVPENPNITWENHIDEDGVDRTYACCDVLIYTALYEEASEILSKPQSMELFPPSIKGVWSYVDGQKVFQFTDGCFFGLQVLGDEVEPCFEGASFFTLNDKVQKAFEKLAQLESTFQLKEEGGKIEMHKMNFKLSEGNEIYQTIFELLNPNYNEEGNWEVNYAICKVTDEYALVMNYESGNFEKIEFKKKDEDEEEKEKKEDGASEEGAEEEKSEEGASEEGAEDKKESKDEEDKKENKKKFELGDASTCYMITVSESEKASLNTVYELNGGSFDELEKAFAKLEQLTQKVAEIEQNLVEKESDFSTLEVERDELTEKYNLSQTELEESKAQTTILQNELEGLKEYKLTVETAKKQAIIDKYAAQLDNETISKYCAEGEDTIEELEKNLAFELVRNMPSLFSKKEEEGYIPMDVPQSGLEAILNKYKK